MHFSQILVIGAVSLAGLATASPPSPINPRHEAQPQKDSLVIGPLSSSAFAPGRPFPVRHPHEKHIGLQPTRNYEAVESDITAAMTCLGVWCAANTVAPRQRVRCRAGSAVAYVCNFGRDNPCSLDEMQLARSDIQQFANSPTGWWDRRNWAKVYGFDRRCGGLFVNGTAEPRCDTGWDYGHGEACGAPEFGVNWQFDGHTPEGLRPGVTSPIDPPVAPPIVTMAGQPVPRRPAYVTVEGEDEE